MVTMEAEVSAGSAGLRSRAPAVCAGLAVGLAALVAVAALTLAGCGGSGQQQSAQIAAGIRKALAGASLQAPGWEQLTVRAVKLGSVRAPQARQTTLTTTATVTIAATIAQQPDIPAASTQRILPPSGASITEPGSVTATLVKDARGDWLVSGASVSTRPATVAGDPAPSTAAAAAAKALFTYNGNLAVYTRSQRPFYATTSVATPAGSNNGAFAPPTLSRFAAAGYLGHAEVNSFLPYDPAACSPGHGEAAYTVLLPGRMAASLVRVTGAQELFRIPPTVQVDGKLMVTFSGVQGQILGGGTLPCPTARVAVSVHAIMVRSMVSGQWLVGDLTVTPPGSGASFGVYTGLGSSGMAPTNSQP